MLEIILSIHFIDPIWSQNKVMANIDNLQVSNRIETHSQKFTSNY